MVHQDKGIHHHIHQHNVHQDMKDMEVPQVALGIITIQEDLLQHGADNTTKTQVHQRLAMICTTEDGGAEADIHLHLDIHKEVHQPHHQELLQHHRPTILQPPNLSINIR